MGSLVSQAHRAGIGLRAQHYPELLAGPVVPLPFVEVHSENFFSAGGTAWSILSSARQRWPISLHGVGLSLGSAIGLDPWHLDQLAMLVERIDPVRVSDHASFARAATGTHHGAVVHAADLLPLAFTAASLQILCENVDIVQQRLDRPILVENIASYVAFEGAEMTEPSFFNQLVRRTGCGVLLDVNNLVVNALNEQRRAGLPVHLQNAAATNAACRWIDALDPQCVGEIHLAGHFDSGSWVIDDHGSAVSPTVWRVFEHALQRTGAVPTLVEWDNQLPPLNALLAEAHSADRYLQIAAGECL